MTIENILRHNASFVNSISFFESLSTQSYFSIVKIFLELNWKYEKIIIDISIFRFLHFSTFFLFKSRRAYLLGEIKNTIGT